jgi:hypothetical protein
MRFPEPNRATLSWVTLTENETGAAQRTAWTFVGDSADLKPAFGPKIAMTMLTRRSFIAAIPFTLSAAAKGSRLTKAEDDFLEALAYRSFRFFWEQSDPGTGLSRDRALADAQAPDRRTWASSASTGFGLTGLCIAAERSWISRAQARERVRTTLHFCSEKAIQENGWFNHFVDCATGARRGTTEVSDIDTALSWRASSPRKNIFAKIPRSPIWRRTFGIASISPG